MYRLSRGVFTLAVWASGVAAGHRSASVHRDGRPRDGLPEAPQPCGNALAGFDAGHGGGDCEPG